MTAVEATAPAPSATDTVAAKPTLVVRDEGFTVLSEGTTPIVESATLARLLSLSHCMADMYPPTAALSTSMAFKATQRILGASFPTPRRSRRDPAFGLCSVARSNLPVATPLMIPTPRRSSGHMTCFL